MNVLQVSSTDLEGARFNGYQLFQMLVAAGHRSCMVVARKQSDDPLVHHLGIVPDLNKAIRGLERALGLQSLLNLTWLALPITPFFKSTDVIHLHLIQGGDFSLLALPLLTYLRPTAWTLHDPWAMTGHCVHPFGCERWLTGCGACPDLAITYPLWYDTTALLWRIKRWRRSIW